ncbi:hypothetical protein ACFQW6_07780 [Nocardioides sp. GCM10028917]|jgi:hypothetical protein|uniref:hypothetical protein n=1 Tax=Nocardioides sp. GCM10028917 TaxID=3273408 RepID=UPI00361756CC
MARTTHELWLEDRQGVIDRGRDRAWWRCLHWCSAVGLLLAVVQWGWVVPSAIVLAGVAISVLLFVACLGKVDLARVRLVVDVAALSALATVGAAGLVAVSAPVGLLVVLGLTITSPSVRRGMRDARTAMRLSLVLARAARKRMGETPW